MSNETDNILAKIDAAVGAPDDETEAEHDARVRMIERDHRAREIRKQTRQ